MNKTTVLTLLVIAVFTLACGVTTLPTTPPAPTETPTAAETRPARLRIPVVTETSSLMVVCVDNANARKLAPDMTLAVVARLERGDVVTLTGEVQQIGGELWQPTDRGMIDPKLICEVK